jgi:hypothetical protein
VCEKIEKEGEGGMAYESDFDVESLDEGSVPFVFGRVFFDCGGWVSMGYGMGKRVEDLRSGLVWTPTSATVAWIPACRILFTLSAVEQRRDEGNSTWTRRHRH